MDWETSGARGGERGWRGESDTQRGGGGEEWRREQGGGSQEWSRGEQRGEQWRGAGGQQRGMERGQQYGQRGNGEQGRGLQRGNGGQRGERGGMLTRMNRDWSSPFQQLERAFGMGPLFSPFFSRAFSGMAEFMPQTDVYVEGDQLVVKADLPGMRREDVEVCIDRGDLVMRGERRHESDVDERDMYRAECHYGSFMRRVPLPPGAEPDEIEAKFQDGVLEVTVPLHEGGGEETRQIEIH